MKEARLCDASHLRSARHHGDDIDLDEPLAWLGIGAGRPIASRLPLNGVAGVRLEGDRLRLDLVNVSLDGVPNDGEAGEGTHRGGAQNERGRPSTCSATYDRIRLVEIGATW